MLLATCASAQTYYESSPFASDADKIRTQMLNDAASRGSRGFQSVNTSADFGRWMEMREVERRAALDDTLAYAARIAAEFEERASMERELARAEEERRQFELNRIAAEQARAAEQQAYEVQMAQYRRYANSNEPRKWLESVWHSQLGHFDRVFSTHGSSQEEFETQTLAQAMREGELLAAISLASRKAEDDPRFVHLVVEVPRLPSVEARFEKLFEHAQKKHVGATLWLANWLLGRDVGLVSAPETLPTHGDARELGLKLLRDLSATHPLLASPWLARELAFRESQGGAERGSEELLSIISQIERLVETQSPLGSWAQFQTGLAALSLRQQAERGVGLLRLATGLDDCANGSRNEPLPVAAALLGRTWLEGRIAPFSPGLAAEAFELLPRSARWEYDRAQGLLARAYQLEFAPQERYGSAKAVPLFLEAHKVFARARRGAADGEARADGLSIPKQATSDERDARLWWLAGCMRFAETDEQRAAARAELDRLVAAGDPWASVMRSYAVTVRPTRESGTSDPAVADLGGAPLFNVDLPAPRLLAALRSMASLARFNSTLDFSASCERVLAMQPRNVFPLGVGELACAYFTGFQPREVEQRAEGPWLFQSFVDAACQHGPLTMWSRAATLAHVLQPLPISPQEWDRRWLARFLEFTKSEFGGSELELNAARRWCEFLREPTREKLEELEARHVEWFGPRESQDGVDSLIASFKIHFAHTSEEAAEATQHLLRLAGERQWHAEALVLDFESYYVDSYLARNDGEGFLRDMLQCAEAIARWREYGIGFVRADPRLRVLAMTKALLLGTERPMRRDIVSLAGEIPDVVVSSLDTLDKSRWGELTLEQLDDPERWQHLVELECVFARKIPRSVPTRERLRYVLKGIARELDGQAALDYAEARRASDPNVDWELSELHREGYEWLPGGAAGGLLATCERAAARAGNEPTLEQLWNWMEAAVKSREVDALERCASYVLSPAVRARFVSDQRAREFGSELADLAYALRDLGNASSDSGVAARCAQQAFELELAAVGCGSTFAFGSMNVEAVPRAADRARVVEALLYASTWNAPLVLPWIDALSREDAALGARLAAPWRSQDGRPTWRFERILEGREELFSGANREQVVYDRDQPLDAHERRALLHLAHAEGSPEAAQVLRDAWRVPDSVIGMSPLHCAAEVSARAGANDARALLDVWPDFALQVREAEGTQLGKGDAEALTALADAARLAAQSLRRALAATSGAEREPVERALRASEEAALDLASMGAYLDLVEAARATGDAARIELARRLLGRDRVNAALIEEHLRPEMTDPTALEPLLVEFGLHQLGSDQHTHVCEYARWRAPRVELSLEGHDEPVKLPRLHPRNHAWRGGWLVQLLANDEKPEDPFIEYTCRALGIEQHDLAAQRIE